MPFDFTNHFIASMAYKSVAAQQMSREAEFFSSKLNLQEVQRIGLSTANISVNPPLRAGLGYIETRHYQYSFPGDGVVTKGTNSNGVIFGFPERGKLAYVTKKDPFGEYGTTLEESLSTIANLPSGLDTNSAFVLARQWLVNISVDVSGLEKLHNPVTSQEYFYDPPLSPETYQATIALGKPPPAIHKVKYIPIFNVTWGGTPDENPPVWVRIFGTTKELMHLRMENTTFLKRPPIVISNAFELNTTPDPPLKELEPLSPAPSVGLDPLTTNRAATP